ncbi:glycine cleavage system transcriptional repressor [Aquisphaera giovannonii]|uniref:Glycine cleavage system transcriptional repressor n=1 Tax=Aquisphaera giovannonii TaxID=406548 RepID=A0A5B9W7Y4_9BACT|nr:ACT domain-containing protein [Aquisphaera giovannonii]QEH36796.1 glycine cleavage system transcriptional repressor [Aquisphaera giovannonii]
MKKTFVLTLTGPDRIGFVEEVTRLLLERGGNVETSRMARLGGEFAVLVLVTLPSDSLARLDADLSALSARGYKVTKTPADYPGFEARAGWRPYRIAVEGADHEGIINGIARYLSEQGIDIESADSECAPGATSGVPLFAMTAKILVPPGLADKGWEDGLRQIGERQNLDITVANAG